MKISCFSLRRMGLVLGILLLLFGAQTFPAADVYGMQESRGARGEIEVVSGYIQEVDRNNIKVEDHYYNVAHVPLKNRKGKEISKALLTQGAKVEISLKNGAVKGVTFIQGYSYD